MKTITLNNRSFLKVGGICIFLSLLFGFLHNLDARGVREPRIEEIDPLSSEPLPVDPLLVQGKLPNGLSYYIRRNLHPANRAELRLVVNAGSALEEEDQQGLAHFIEHMAFNGTARFPKNSLVHWLESIGMRFGPETNAYTSFDETVYQLSIPLDDPNILDTALNILVDWAGYITLAEEEIEKERGVILEEWRLGRGASSRVRDKQYPVLLKGSRYAERLPIGKPEIIQSAPPEALRRFYRNWYRPDLMAVVAVGDFFPVDMERLIREKFSSLEAPLAFTPATQEVQQEIRPLFPVPDHGETLVSIATDPELTQSTVGIFVKTDVRIPTTFQEYREELAESIFFYILNTRFSDISRKEDAPFLFAGGGSGSLVRTKKLSYVSAAAEEGGIVNALEGITREVRRIQVHGVTEAEIQRAKADILREVEQSYRERNTIPSSSYVSSYIDAYLQGTPVLGPEYTYRLFQRLLPGIKEDEVSRYAELFLSPQNRVILVSAPTREADQVPTETDLVAILERTAREEVEPYAEEPPISTLLEKSPMEGSIERVTSPLAAAYGAVEWKLSNGARVLLKSTDFKADEVLFSAFSLGGTSLAEERDYLSAVFSVDLVEQSGLGEFSSTRLEKYLTGKKISISPSLDEAALRFHGSSSRQDLETFFQLLHLYFTAPRLDESAVRRYLDQVRTSLRNEENSPEARFGRMIQEELKGGHFRSQPLTADRIDEVDPHRSIEFFKELVSNPGEFTFLFVGNLKPEELEPYLKQYLASVQPKEVSIDRKIETGKILDRGVRFRKTSLQKTLKAGKEPKSLVALYFTGDLEWSFEEITRLSLLEDYLDIRLREVLREDTGGTYGVGVSISPRRTPVPEYSILVSFGTSPNRVPELVELTLKEIERLKREFPVETDVQKVREQRFRLLERAWRENSFWRYFLEQELFHQAVSRSLGIEESNLPQKETLFSLWERIARSLTPSTLQEMIQKYFTEERLLKFILEPEQLP
ncbi:MAG: insulinase family protein [Spirochaetales bacterium]|nr:insulinase family protein [Spirochaetales bacterium]